MSASAAVRRQNAPCRCNGDDDRQLAQGALSVINNQIAQATGTITLKAIFPNQNTALWPGEFVNAHLVLRTVKNGVTIAPGAVQMGSAGAFVHVIKPDSAVEARPVEVLQVENERALIGKGLAAGDNIVVSGQAGLSPDVQVAVQQGAPGQMNARQPRDWPGRGRQHRGQHGAGRRRRDQPAMNISEPFIRRPIATALLMAALLVGGIIGYNLLAVAALPTVEFPTISVSASLPGANPETMASSVAQPLTWIEFAVIGDVDNGIAP